MTEDEEIDGAAAAAAILNAMAPDKKAKLVQNIQKEAPELADKIEDNLYNFDEIAGLTPQSIQTLIAAVSKDDLLLSLKLAGDEVKEAIFTNLSERRRAILKEELVDLPPTKVVDAQAAQRNILDTVEKLRAEGKIKSHDSSDTYI
jgi:flagellar motor switch protein FliG